MPSFCCVYLCGSRFNRDNYQFYRFPTIQVKTSEKLKVLSKRRQMEWLRVIKRKDIKQNQIKHLRICSKHFISGKKANLIDIDNKDWIPSLHLGNNEQIKVSRPSPRKRVVASIEDIDENDENVSSGNHNNELILMEENIHNSSVGVQTILNMVDISSFDVVDLQEENKLLKAALKKYEIKLENFEGDDKKTCFFTGISTYNTMKIIFEKIQHDIVPGDNLDKFKIFFLTLKILRHNPSFKLMGYEFNIAATTISRHFYRCLNILYCKLRSLIYWPTREDIKKTTPEFFKRCFGDRITCIIDCFEVMIEKSSSLKAATETWSNYKHSPTLKYLIGISPQGMIVFISDWFGGRASDKFVTENSGFFNNLCENDVIMADRGFLIKDAADNLNVKLEIPVFTKGKSQLHPVEIEKSRNISNVRSHVERIIGQIRMRYPILSQRKFPMHLVGQSNNSVVIADQIATVCCSLINLCKPIVLQPEN